MRWIRTVKLGALVMVLGSALFVGVVPVGAEASATSCDAAWGSLAEESTSVPASKTHLRDARTGQHRCFDRVVLDLDGPATGYQVEYVTEVREEGSGHVIALEGGAFLQIRLLAPAYDDSGAATYQPADDASVAAVDGYQTLRQVAFGGSFEGQSIVAVGVRARLPFRVFVLDGPGNSSRLIIDVAHRW